MMEQQLPDLCEVTGIDPTQSKLSSELGRCQRELADVVSVTSRSLVDRFGHARKLKVSAEERGVQEAMLISLTDKRLRLVRLARRNTDYDDLNT